MGPLLKRSLKQKRHVPSAWVQELRVLRICKIAMFVDPEGSLSLTEETCMDSPRSFKEYVLIVRVLGKL